ncbi:pilus assembly protein PilP [Inhella inkyongensis]
MRKCLPAIAAVAFFAGCSANLDELHQWVENERRIAKPNVTPLVPPKKFQPDAYEAQDGVDPFSTQKLTVAVRQEAVQPNSVLAAEMNRRREPLEAFPLDSMQMVGSMAKAGRRHAILKVDNLLYYVKVGDYIGQNFGRILKIEEAEVALREIVQDASGEWVERVTNLSLQEAAR